jgi:hypothetical protein
LEEARNQRTDCASCRSNSVSKNLRGPSHSSASRLTRTTVSRRFKNAVMVRLPWVLPRSGF